MCSTTSSAYGGRTLDTLPPEVKDEIFSYFLLGKNVKYSTMDKRPGHRYKVETSTMLVNKRLNQDASMYVRSHNEFVLIHARWFAFEVDQGRFLPYVAIGNAAKTFKFPTVEANIKHQGTKCGCTPGSDCSVRQQRVPEKTTRALLMAENLDIFVRHLKLAYHIWPSLPIYIHSVPSDRPVKWSASPAQTHIDFVWKINKPIRQDLTRDELHKRQVRLSAPIFKLVNHGQNVKILGAEHDLVSSTKVHLHRPEASSTISPAPALSPSLVASITRMADKRITGQEYSDEDEDEDEDDGDEAEHSDEGDSNELEGSDKDDSDNVGDRDESVDSEADHMPVGVFNPRHSRGESTFAFHTETRSDGT
ncbi:hypothetical protein E4T42_02000 [Aureobasidium subglaciale]|nr:hypothetical protein E4T42_02000 [Aureobasidium subglaciale]